MDIYGIFGNRYIIRNLWAGNIFYESKVTHNTLEVKLGYMPISDPYFQIDNICVVELLLYFAFSFQKKVLYVEIKLILIEL